MHPSWVALSSTSFGWGKGGNITSVGWQVTLCDPIWHVSSRSGVATLRTAIHLLLTYLLTYMVSGLSVCLSADHDREPRRTVEPTETRRAGYEPFHSRTLHRLPVQQRIDYKVALPTFKVRSTSTPSYLRLLIQDREHGRNLRSTTTTLCQPFTTTFAKRAFRCCAPAV